MNVNPIYKFIGAFLGIVLFAGGGWWLYDGYLSPEARNRPDFDQKKYDAFIKNAEDVLRADTYGGKTPQETLDMFVAALRAGDVELASKYFALDTNSQSPNYLTRKEWEENLKKIIEYYGIDYVLDSFKNIRFVKSSWDEGLVGFNYLNGKGEIIGEMRLRLNTYSNIWKIESL